MKFSGRFARRSFLKAIGAGPGLLPLFEPELARAACLPGGRKRLVVVVWGNGNHQWVTADSASGALPPTLADLEPHRADLLIFDKLSFKNSLDGPNKAHDSVSTMLTGQRTTRARVGGGISLDYHVGNALKLRTGAATAVINLGVKTQRPYGSCSWTGPALVARSDPDPFHAFDAMFGGSARGDAGSGRTAADRARTRKSVLDFLQRDIARFSRGLGREDRNRMDGHLASVRQLEAQLAQPALAAGCGKPTLPAPFDVTSSDAFEICARAQIDIGVAALAAGVGDVLTLQVSDGVGSNLLLSWLGFKKIGASDPVIGDDNGHHAVSHAEGGVAGGMKKTAVDRWFYGQVAYLIGRLKAQSEGTRSVFDSSVVLVTNNMDRGANHSVQNVGWLMAGTAGGYFKAGRIVPSGNASQTQVLAGIANAFGVPTAGFIDPSLGDSELPGLRS